MTKHIIIWQLKDELSENEKLTVMKNAKPALEGLLGKIDGLTEIKVITDKYDSSNGDMMLYSVFESRDALKGYQVHPDHVAAANTFVRPFTKSRLCMDFEE